MKSHVRNLYTEYQSLGFIIVRRYLNNIQKPSEQFIRLFNKFGYFNLN